MEAAATEVAGELGALLRFSYGIGHVLNDICASMWFTYLLVFFHLVLKFDATNAGLLMLVGQVADALATPFVGIEVDRGATGCSWNCLARLGFGHRKTWHLVGTLCVLASFPFIFFPCIGCESSDEWAQLIYYSAFIVIFQFGWASVQISHLSLIPHLSPHEHQRTKLIAIRYTFTVISNILVYVITWTILHMTSDITDDQIGPQDMFKFQHIVLIGLAIGIFCSIFFHCGTPEPPPTRSMSIDSSQEIIEPNLPARRKMSPKKFMKVPQFYQVALLYMCTRLFVNLSQVYMPLYLHDSLKVNAEALATVPLAMFLSSFAFSFLVGHVNKFCGRKISYLFGALLGGGACAWVYFGTGDFYSKYEIYGVASLFGAGSSVLLVTSLGITADFIGSDSESGAFVYGSMSFADKLSNGLAVTAIQSFKCLTECPHYYRNMLSFVCGGAALLGFLATVTLIPRKSHNEDATQYNRLENEVHEADNSENHSVQEH
ncbi:major facilitator superfamily domain-containing protein 12-like [Neocloeon triangulifer]|uniref:major facilitator superfamily domain-containing protein 12-like n=1 Tax=Neocloeon triangulifer TaxID=2078957 RepID=UPI00286ED79D|nr:major facilitator superfamily domain-containing protein 12-like [Neocloeon triangulifer]XP_059489130.1 major facilitator superfamily domain-containing protein 12-like [Neocloeon triangulifer]XP_059489139.1 major facilitator superfamily domain-containing protein 12-like [Neocloeon triangulifer]XP_059489148.1 major facilitator superfamily domain-containing protein 12-like [Neocloeon triangulifer]